MESTHIGFSVPSGTGQILLFETDPARGSLRDLRFVLGGRQQTLRINRILTVNSSRTLDIAFASATPHEVTLFFARNPMAAGCSRFHITVDNLSSTDEPLQVSAIYEPTGEPCLLDL